MPSEIEFFSHELDMSGSSTNDGHGDGTGWSGNEGMEKYTGLEGRGRIGQRTLLAESVSRISCRRRLDIGILSVRPSVCHILVSSVVRMLSMSCRPINGDKIDHTFMRLSPRSVIWYRLITGDTRRLRR